MIPLKRIKKLILLPTVLIAACSNNSNQSFNSDFCIYVDPKSPYFNPNKLSSNQLEECKIRAATIIEIQAIQYDILKQRYPNLDKNQSTNEIAAAQQDLSQSIARSSSTAQSSQAPRILTNAQRKNSNSAINKTNTVPILENKRKPLYHRDAGQLVDMNYQVIVTEAGARLADSQIEQIKSTPAVAVLADSTGETKGKVISTAQSDPVQAILARQSGGQGTITPVSSTQTAMAAVNESASVADKRKMFENLGKLSASPTSIKKQPAITADTAAKPVIPDEPINSESLDLLKKIKARGDVAANNPVEAVTQTPEAVINLPNASETKETNPNQIEKFNKSVAIEPIPSI